MSERPGDRSGGVRRPVAATAPRGLITRATDRVAGMLCTDVFGRLIARVFRDRIRFRGAVLDTSSPRVRAVTKAALFWRLYESPEARFVSDRLRHDVDVIELGGSIGAIAAVASRRLRRDARLVSVEADPDLVPVLSRNLRRNAGSITTHAVHGAVDYATDESMTWYHAADDTRGGGVVSVRADVPPQLVPRTTLRDIRDRFGIREYALICDIEGGEAGIVAGGVAELEGCVQAIIEWHDADFRGERFTPESMDAAMCALGFVRSAARRSVAVYDRLPTQTPERVTGDRLAPRPSSQRDES